MEKSHQYQLCLVHNPQLKSKNNFYTCRDSNLGPSTKNEKELTLQPAFSGRDENALNEGHQHQQTDAKSINLF